MDKKPPQKNHGQPRHRFVDGETMVMPLAEILRNRGDLVAESDDVFNEPTTLRERSTGVVVTQDKQKSNDSVFDDPTSTRLQTPDYIRQRAAQAGVPMAAPSQPAHASAPAPAPTPVPAPASVPSPKRPPPAESPSGTRQVTQVLPVAKTVVPPAGRPPPPPEGSSTRVLPGQAVRAPEPVHAPSPGPAPTLAPPQPAARASSPRPVVDTSQRNQVVVFFACKGGAGATTLSINVAHHFAREQNNTCLVDMDLQLGDALAALALQPRFTIAQATEMVQKGTSVTSNLLPKHASGVSVLSQVGSLDDLDRVSSEGMAQLVEDLRGNYDVVVVDGVRDFSDNVLAVLDVADKIAIITVQEVLAIRRARWSFNILRKIGFDPKDITIVVNRFSAQSEIPFATIKRIFDPCLVMTVPAEAGLVVQSLNRGVPLQELNPQHTLTRNIGRLAKNLVGNVIPEEQDVTAIGKLPFWKRLLGRKA